MIKCRKCSKGALEIAGYLKRVNELGVEGIWECRPACGADISPDDAVVCAILDDSDWDYEIKISK